MTSTDIFKGASIIRSKITSLVASSVFSCGSSSVTSSTFTCEGYRNALAYLTVNDTGSTAAPASLQFTPQFATDSAGTYFNFLEGIWASMTFSAAQLQTSTFYRAHSLPLTGRRMRFRIERDSTIDNTNFTASVSVEAVD